MMVLNRKWRGRCMDRITKAMLENPSHICHGWMSNVSTIPMSKAANVEVFVGMGDDKLQGDEPVVSGGMVVEGNDYLDGAEGSDLILGNGGDDNLIGGEGDDTLYGDNGNGAGAQGNDYLDGGEGSDTYIYDVGDGIDHICDTKAGKNILRFGAAVDKNNIKLHLGSPIDTLNLMMAVMPWIGCDDEAGKFLMTETQRLTTTQFR